MSSLPFLHLQENKDWNEMIQDAQRRGNIIQTSKDTYRTSALKILKSRPFSRSRVATPERDAQEPSAFSGTKQQALPGPDTQRPPVPLPTPAGNRTPQETQKPRPPPVAQGKPIQDRPQDPRLFRRAESACKAADGQEGETSALWASSRQKNPGPLPAQSRSNSADTLGETSSRVGTRLPSRAPSTEILDQRPSFLAEQFKTWENVPGYPRRILETSQEKDDSTQPKKRRTTF